MRWRPAPDGGWCAAAAGLALALGLAACGAGSSRTVRVTIPPHASFRAAADSLRAAGVLEWSFPFRAYAKLRGLDTEIRAGVYELPQDISWGHLLDTLRRGEAVEARLTIPEGWSLAEIVPALARAIRADTDSVRAAVRDSAMLHRLGIPSGTLEGYLFPDTYRFAYGMPARDAVREMVDRFESVWDTAWNARLQQIGMTRHQVITLASIIEKEAKLPAERPLISAVYHNRLRLGMPLQADPTVQYARGEHVPRVSYKDLEVASPYNTYKHAGLPPGPIACPGRASIQAALYPADVPYLYFVADQDGHHEFRQTFREHEAAKSEIRARAKHARATSDSARR